MGSDSWAHDCEAQAQNPVSCSGGYFSVESLSQFCSFLSDNPPKSSWWECLKTMPAALLGCWVSEFCTSVGWHGGKEYTKRKDKPNDRQSETNSRGQGWYLWTFPVSFQSFLLQLEVSKWGYLPMVPAQWSIPHPGRVWLLMSVRSCGCRRPELPEFQVRMGAPVMSIAVEPDSVFSKVILIERIGWIKLVSWPKCWRNSGSSLFMKSWWRM